MLIGWRRPMAPLLYRLLIREMWKYLILIVALICLVIMNNHYYYYAFNLYRPSPEGSFRIMTYNTNGVSGEYEDSTFVEDFLLAVDSILPQVLALQEMREKYSPMLCEGLQQRFPYNSLVELEGSALKNKDAACLFSQFPIKSFFYTAYALADIGTSSMLSACRINKGFIYRIYVNCRRKIF